MTDVDIEPVDGDALPEGAPPPAAVETAVVVPDPRMAKYGGMLRAGLPDAEGNRLPRSLSGPVTIP